MKSLRLRLLLPLAVFVLIVAFLWVGLSRDPRLAVHRETAFDLPALLAFPHRSSLLIETDLANRDEAVGMVQSVLLRLLARVPPSKVRLVLVDPVGLGQSFAGFMHLADEMEALVGDRIWTEPRHIEQKLTDLTEHMETVIQKYLRNEFDSIEAYNEKAGEIAEPLRYLVITDFPTNITDVAAKRLASILASGPRCGVHTIILRTRTSAKNQVGMGSRGNRNFLSVYALTFPWVMQGFRVHRTK